MRWLLLALILANGGLYLWYQNRPPQAVSLEPPAPVASITLLSEIDTRQLARRADPAKEAARSAAESAQAEAPVSADRALARSADPQGAGATQEAGANAGAAGADGATAGAPVERWPAPPGRGLACYTLSGGKDEATVTALLRVLSEAAVRVAFVRRQERDGREGYWVYIPDSGERGFISHSRERLESLGVESYLVTRGLLEGQLSVGLYRNEASARALYRALQEFGFSVRMMQRSAAEPGYLVDIWVSEAQWPALKQALSPLAQWRLEKNEKNLCEGVAGSENLG